VGGAWETSARLRRLVKVRRTKEENLGGGPELAVSIPGVVLVASGEQATTAVTSGYGLKPELPAPDPDCQYRTDDWLTYDRDPGGRRRLSNKRTC
jgi:hypothetical protein